MAQWKRAGPITQRSVDRNYALLRIFMIFFRYGVPLAQRIARWTSNPKVLGSIPRWDDLFCPTNPTVRMAEWSKAPDSRLCLASLIGSD